MPSLFIPSGGVKMLCPFCNKEIADSDALNEQKQYPARRTFRARNDASVGTIKCKIEEIFGLPEGSVVICTPEQKAFRADALISTVRRRWEYE